VKTFVIAFVAQNQEVATGLKQALLQNVEYSDSTPAEINFEGWKVFAFTAWPGSEAKLPKVIDAVMVDLGVEDEAAFKEYFSRFEDVVHKLAPMHSEAQLPLAIELNLSITFKPQAESFLPSLLALDAELLQLISAEFTTFDQDSSGFINLAELREISRKLGAELSEEDLQTALAELDSNKDGKISLEEFTVWWKNGRKGKSRAMRKLTQGVAKLKNLLNHAHAEIVKLTEVEEEPKFVNLSVAIGNDADVTPNFGVKVSAFNSANEARTQANARVDATDFYVQIALKTATPAETAQAFNDTYANVKAQLGEIEPDVAMVLNFIEVKTTTDDEKVYITISSPFAQMFTGDFVKFRPLLGDC
jgi:hypothetical protein